MGLTTKAGDFVNSLTQNLSTSYGEIAQEIAKGYSKKVNNAESALNKKFKESEFLQQKAKEILNSTNDATLAREVNKVVHSEISDKEKFNWIRQQQVKRHGSLLGNAAFAGQVAKAYMFEDGKKSARMGTYAAGAVGLRMLSGGNLTHNNTGERDIVGVPFI